MFDPERLLGQMLSGSLGNLLGGRGRSLLSGDLGSKAALGLGALGVAIAAYEHYTDGRHAAPATTGAGGPPPPPPSAGPPPPPPPTRAATSTTQAQDDALLIVRTMIAAAAADGRIDDDERRAIVSRAADVDDRRVLEQELAAPRTPAQLAATTRPGFAPQVYAAALIAVRVDTLEESDWLEQLGFALGLDGGTRAQIAQDIAAHAA